MYYCFLNEDIENLVNDPLLLQKNYAQAMGRLCIGNLTKQQIFDEINHPVNLVGKKVLLRSTYDNMIMGFHLLQKCGAELVETNNDVEKIESWLYLKLTHRNYWDIELSDLKTPSSNKNLQDFLIQTDMIFLKSKQKGFSAVIKSSKLLQHEPEVFSFLNNKCKLYGVQLLLTKYCTLKTDSIGTRESRHVIINGQVMNSSRLLRSVKHTVPKSHIVKAHAIANQIRNIKSFPKNYILDLGEFSDKDGNFYLDIIELNPLSCSMCYVNNSIFDTILPEIEEKHRLLLMGPEYCYDAIKNPENYYISKPSNRNYSYIATERYSFL